MEISFSESARVGHQTCVEYSPRMSAADLKSRAWFQIDQRLEAAFDKCQSWQQQNSKIAKDIARISQSLNFQSISAGNLCPARKPVSQKELACVRATTDVKLVP